MKAIDAELAGGNEHVAISTNDLVELFNARVSQSDLSLGGGGEEVPPGESKPRKGKALEP